MNTIYKKILLKLVLKFVIWETLWATTSYENNLQDSNFTYLIELEVDFYLNVHIKSLGFNSYYIYL